MSNLVHNDFVIVTIEGNINKLRFNNIISNDSDGIKFMYKGNINTLLVQLNGVKLKSLLIEEPSLEEIFMHYYRGEKDV